MLTFHHQAQVVVLITTRASREHVFLLAAQQEELLALGTETVSHSFATPTKRSALTEHQLVLTQHHTHVTQAEPQIACLNHTRTGKTKMRP